jgi:PPK2 family polyphosphate:nucleotide phosphotransferase
MTTVLKKIGRRRVGDGFRVEPGSRFRLSAHDPAWAGTEEMRAIGGGTLKQRAREILERSRLELAAAQEVLYADDRHSLLIILQGRDAAGKDGTIRHVMSGVNPQGCQVFSFKHPSAEELDHNFLWRYWKSLPERGRIGIFNRSYYEEVLIVKVRPEIFAAQKLPQEKFGGKFWAARYEDINAFERHLDRNGTRVLKFFLNISKHEQKKRLLERLRNPDKRWKFSAADLAERALWDDYMRAYEDAIRATSTRWAPWHVIPADRKWVTRTLVARIVVEALRSLDLKYPEPTRRHLAEIRKAKTMLAAETE